MGRRSAAFAVLGAMWLGGCDSTGPTGSSAAVPPVDAAAEASDDAAPPDADSGAPLYSSVVGFMPSPPGGGNSGVSRSTNNPANNRSAADLAKVHGDYLIVATQPVSLPDGYGPEAIQTRGLLIFALGPSGLPELVGELALDGTPVALEVSDGAITLVVGGRNAYESDSVPTDPMPFSATRLLRIDWSDPAAPRLVASADLDGEFWHVEVAGDLSVVLRSLPVEKASVCGGGEGRGPQRMQVTTFALSADGYQRLEDQTLVGDGYTAFLGPGYLIGVADASMSPPQTLQALRISPTEVTLAPPLEVPGVIKAASMDGPLLAVAYDTTSAAELALYDVARAGSPQLLGTAPVPPQASSISPLGGAVGWLLESNVDEPVVVDTSDPLAPVVTRLPGVFPAVRLGSVVMGVGFEPAARTASFSTWDVTEPRAPAWLSTVVSDWPYSAPYWSADEANRRLLYPFSRTSNGVSQAGFGRVDLDPAGIPVLTAPVPVETVTIPLGHARAAYLASFGSLETVPFDGSGTTEVYQYYAEDPRRVLDEVTTPEYAARLVRSGVRVIVELEGAAGTVSIELTHRADQLLLVGNRLVALAFENGVVCPGYDLTASPLCTSTTDQAGLSVISLGPDPRLELGMLLSDAPGAPSLPSDALAYSSWFGYLALDGERLLLPMMRELSCRTSAACDALGITPPDPDAGTAVVHESQQWLYVLDVAGVEPALLPLRVETMYDEPYPRGGNLEGSVQRSGAIVAFPRTEVDYAPGGQPVGPVRHWLERLQVSDTGALTPLPSVSIPGQALGLHDDATTLVTLDATAESDGGAVAAHVRRSSIRDHGAYVEESLTLGPGLRDAIALGDRVFVIMGPPAWCEPAPTSQVFAVSSTAGMTQLPALTLPGDRWRFARAEAPWPPDTLLLVDGLGWGWARVELDVADATGAPRVIRYYSDGR